MTNTQPSPMPEPLKYAGVSARVWPSVDNRVTLDVISPLTYDEVARLSDWLQQYMNYVERGER